MKNIVIVGGTKGIGKAIVASLVDNNNITCLSRSKSEFSHDNYSHIKYNSLEDELPDIEFVDCLIYCPGSINLKPITNLSIDDFRNDFEINVIGAVKCIKKYLQQLKNGVNPSILLFSTSSIFKSSSNSLLQYSTTHLTNVDFPIPFAPQSRILFDDLFFKKFRVFLITTSF